MTFLYDIGRVLLDFDFESSLARLLPAGCTDPHERMTRLLDRKDDFEAGAIDPDTYIHWALGVLGSDATPAEFRDAWQKIFTPNEAMWERVRELSAAGHRLILFSNTNAIHCPWVFDAYPEFSLFDEAVLSFETGSIKPHPPIYQHALDTHRLIPRETLYIDDMPENIATGREFGFQCHQYDLTDHPAFERWLSSFPI
ncbi:MAG: HAD family phosphatase [Luteolibacter sp.]|jgi:putative hydrolase of the HAD superfamily|nr:HAD family phosphatase [Luteolibacter sp.]